MAPHSPPTVAPACPTTTGAPPSGSASFFPTRPSTKRPTHLHRPHPCRQASHFAQTTCAGRLDPDGVHEELCNIGGGVVRRHHAIRTWLAKKFRFLTHATVLEEEHVPRLDRTLPPTARHPHARTEQARIDIITQTDLDTTMFDVVVANVATTDPDELRRRVTEPGRPARLAALRKRSRYNAEVDPFPIEDTGRLHPQTARTLHYLAEQTYDPQAEYQLLVAELQTILFSTTFSFQRTAHGLRAY